MGIPDNLKVFISDKEVKLSRDNKKKIWNILKGIDFKITVDSVKRKLKRFIAHMNPDHKKKLKAYTLLKLDDFLEMRDFVVLYLYTYDKLSSQDIADQYKSLITNEKGKALSRRTIHRIVTRYKLNRSDLIAMELKRKKKRRL